MFSFLQSGLTSSLKAYPKGFCQVLVGRAEEHGSGADLSAGELTELKKTQSLSSVMHIYEHWVFSPWGEGVMLDPIWNKPVKETDRALDPLGMNRVTDRLLDNLLSGITTQTPRARYYSFYVWAVNQIGKRGTAKSYRQFREDFYGIERIFMLGCIAHEQDPAGRNRNHNAVNGSLKGRNIWYESEDMVSMGFNYFGNKLGGYGQYYQGSISKLDLIMQSGESVYEQPTELGLRIADAFDSVAKEVELVGFCDREKVTKGNLLKIGKKACLCRLRDTDAPDREVLRELFFGLIENESISTTQQVTMRPDTLSLIMYFSRFADRAGFKLTDQHFLDSCYFHQMCSDGNHHDISIPDTLVKTADFWKMFRAHDYISYSAEALLCCFLEFLNKRPRIGGTLEEFLERATSQKVLDGFRKLTKTSLPSNKLPEVSLSEITSEIAATLGIRDYEATQISASKNFDSSVNMLSASNEFTAMNMLEQATKLLKHEEVLASWPALLLFVYMRFYWIAKTREESWLRLIQHTDGDLSPARFVKDLEERISRRDFTLVDFIKWFVVEYVVNQALHIFYEKSERSIHSRPRSWFHPEGNYYKPDREYEAAHRNTRFESAITILEDLGLIDIQADKIKLTTDGKDYLQRLGMEV